MQHDVERHCGVGQVDGAQEFFRIVHVDVAKHREPQETHCLLAVDQQDDPRAALTFDLADEPLTRCFEKALLENRLESGGKKKIHNTSPGVISDPSNGDPGRAAIVAENFALRRQLIELYSNRLLAGCEDLY